MGNKEFIALLPDLAVLVRVVELGSFSAAAKELGMTPSAVSKQVARLERALQTRLLERSTRKLRLSDAGAEVFKRSQEMVQAARAALAQSDKFSDAPRGLVRLSAPKAFARAVIHPQIAGFLHAYPQVNVQLIVTDRHTDPIEDDIDLIIRITDQPPLWMAARPLMKVRHVLCASPSYVAEHGSPAHPQELAQHACIYLGENAMDNRWQFKQGDESVTVKVYGRYIVNHTELRLEGAFEGLGITCLPYFSAKAALARGEVLQILPDWEFAGAYTGTAYVLYPANRFLPPKLRVFIDYLAEKLASDL